MTRTEKFIQDNKRVLLCGRDYYNPDTSFMKREDFDKKQLKVLVVFPTPSDTKAVSTTKEALNDFVIEHCPNTFIDFCFIPNASDIKLFDKHSIPYAVGLITHLDASHYDIIGFSISVLSETITMASIINSFQRCDKPIDLTWSERKDKPIGEQPIIFCGGITAVCGDIMYGELGDGRQAFSDFTYLGECGKLDVVFRRYLEARSTGQVTRTPEDRYVYGYADDPKEAEYESIIENVKTNQDFIDSLFDLRCIYQPQAYEVKFNDKTQIISNKKINPKAQDWVKPLYPHEMSKDLGIGRAIINASGENTGTTQTQVSEGCSAAGCCSFCAEGNYTGGWCEKPKEQILNEIREAKKYSAGYKYKPFSFNCNYVTDYKGMLYEFIQRYPKVTFINMRMEELGRDVDAIRMMKLIGSNRISAPMEGISPRIQNQLLNKCLSEQALNAFMDDMVHAKMGDIKVGGIFTGYEEDEDFQWICDFVDKFKKRAAQEGGNFPFRLKVTPLVHYNLTPCEYLERKSARKSYAGEHWLTDEWYEKFREHNVFFKVNGFRYSTFLEQSIIDLGRKATHIVYEEILKKGVEVYSLRSVAKPEIIQAFKDEINPDYFFEARDPEHYISLSHRIHIDLMGSYIPRARRLIRAYKNGNIFDNEADIRCLKTYDGAPTKCYKMCAAKDPLKIYNDVEMDEEGNLHGEFRLLLGCERCHDNEARKARLARPTPFTKNSNDILAAPRMKKVQRIRFVIQRNKEYDVLNPNNTAHTFIAKFLQRSDTLLDAYHSMNIHSMAWQSDPNIPYVASGTQIVDTIWTKPVYKEVQSLIESVNSDMQSLKILKASEIFMDDKLDCDDFNIFRFETRLPYDLFATSSPAYKGEVKIKGDFEDTIKKDPKCKAPVFIQAGKVIGYFALPFKYNPILYMQQFLNAKKVTVNKIVQEIDFECIMQVRPNTNVVCKNCHEEQATVSLTTGKNFPFGTQCLCKALLSKEMQK